jgi:hypothetical protein
MNSLNFGSHGTPILEVEADQNVLLIINKLNILLIWYGRLSMV